MTAKRPSPKPPAGTPLPDDFVFGMSALRKPQEIPPGYLTRKAENRLAECVPKPPIRCP